MSKGNFCQSIVAFLIVITIFPSCVSTKQTVYFNDFADSVKVRDILKAEFKEPLIQVDDILGISVQTIDPVTNAALNQAAAAAGGGSGSSGPSQSFLVDEDGNVEVPVLGIIKLAGLTTKEARAVLRKEAGKYYNEPTVQVRFANFKVTLVGEVASPATYTVPNEKFSVLDAIGMAGDLTIYGKRENVMLIRDNGSERKVVRLDLTSSSLLHSPYFYLKQNDVIYVEPGKARIAANNSAGVQRLTIAMSVITLLITVLTRL